MQVVDQMMPLHHSFPHPLPKHVVKFKIRQALIFIALVCASLISLAIWGSWNSRQYQLHEKEVAMSNLAHTLSSQVQATIKRSISSCSGSRPRLKRAAKPGCKHHACRRCCAPNWRNSNN